MREYNLLLGEGEAREGLAVNDGGDIIVGGFDGIQVWFHHVKQLLPHRIGIIMRVAAIKAVLANLPRRHALELHFDESTDLVLTDVGGKAVGEIVEDFGVFGENNSGATDFLDDGTNHILLVLDAVAIAGSIAVALAGKGECKFAIHMNVAFRYYYASAVKWLDLLIGVDVNSANRIH